MAENPLGEPTEEPWYLHDQNKTDGSPKGYKVNYAQFIRDIQQELPFAFYHGRFIVYRNHYWTLVDADEHLDAEIYRIYSRHRDESLNADEFLDDVHFKKLLSTMQHISHITDAQINPDGLINCLNGVLNLTTKILTPHNQEPFFYCFAVNYLPQAKHPQWDAFLQQVLPRETDRLTLQEFCGYLLVRDYRFHKYLLLYGEGGNGKDTLLNTIITICGGDNQICTKSLPDLHNKSFATADLIGKVLCLQNEPDKELLKNSDILKKMTGQTTMSGELKYGDSFNFKNAAKVMISCNELPTFTDMTEGFARRPLAIGFNVRIPDEQVIVNYHLILLQEASGIFNWMIEGYDRLTTQGRFSVNDDLAKQWIYENDTIAQFLAERVIRTNNKSDRISIDNLFVAFKDWCFQVCCLPFKKGNFAKSLRKERYGLKDQFTRDSALRYLTGVRLRISDDDILRFSEITLQTVMEAIGKTNTSLSDIESHFDVYRIGNRDRLNACLEELVKEGMLLNGQVGIYSRMADELPKELQGK